MTLCMKSSIFYIYRHLERNSQMILFCGGGGVGGLSCFEIFLKGNRQRKNLLPVNRERHKIIKRVFCTNNNITLETCKNR